MAMETFDRGLEDNNSKSSEAIQFSENKEYEELLKKEKDDAKKGDNVKREKLIDELFGRNSTDTLSDSEIWEKIEGYLQEFKNNPDFIESGDMNFLDKIRNAEDTLEKPLLYKAAAFLLANFEIGGSSYRSLDRYVNSGLWVKALLGRVHYEQFLEDKQNCINELSGVGGEKDKLQDALANCEMNYIVNNIRGSGGELKYFGYHSSKGRGSLPSQFADSILSLSERWFSESSVKESYEKITHTDFDMAKHDFERLMKSSRFSGALGNLEKMLSLSKNDEQKSKSQKAFLICMLSGVLDFGGEENIRKQVCSWAKTLGFLPGMLVEDLGHSEQVVALLDDFSKGDFSKHVKSVFHTSDLLRGETNIGDLINEINSWWSVDMMHKFEQYSKSDFLTKDFSSSSALGQLQNVVQNMKDNSDGGFENNNERTDKREKVQEFIRTNCSEPVGGVNKIVPYKELLESLIQSAEDEFKRVKSSGVSVESQEYKDAFEIKNKLELFKKSKREKLSDEEKKQIEGLAKDERVYELPVYRQLIENGGFILPSDVRDYYDSADQVSVHHLGIDYNVKAGTEVKSMYKGKVVSSGLDGGFGHKVIIEHETDDGTKFYSLYGHLGSNGLPKRGDSIGKGEKIGEVGIYEENGNWQEHLHFQIMERQDSQPGYYKGKSKKYNVITGNYDVLKSFGKK